MITVAYIMGVGLSGSTLLTLLLGSHPEVATVGEVYIAPRSKTSGLTYVCSCGLPYHECTFWQRVTKEMEKHDCPFDIHESDLSFELFGNGLSFLLLRANLRHPLLEVGRHVGLTLLPRARSELNRLLHPSPDVGKFRAGQHIVGNIMRLSTTLEIRLDERWKTALTVAQTNSIQQILGKMNRSYGYGLDLSGFSD